MKQKSSVNMDSIKAVFFDARDTLGEVDQPGHLVPFRPSTEKLLEAIKALGLRMGVITNLPADVTADQGKEMVLTAELSQDPVSSKVRTIGNFIPRENIITNHEAGANKPDPKIYHYAAKQLGVKPHECLFVGENLIENLGAALAGMEQQMKPCPPGREFLPSLQSKIGASPTDSGRQFEAMLEHEHLLGERIFACGAAIGNWLRKLTDGKAPPLDQGKWISPRRIKVPTELLSVDGVLCASDRPFCRSGTSHCRRAYARGGDSLRYGAEARPVGIRPARSGAGLLACARRRLATHPDGGCGRPLFCAHRLPTDGGRFCLSLHCPRGAGR